MMHVTLMHIKYILKDPVLDMSFYIEFILLAIH